MGSWVQPLLGVGAHACVPAFIIRLSHPLNLSVSCGTSFTNFTSLWALCPASLEHISGTYCRFCSRGLSPGSRELPGPGYLMSGGCPGQAGGTFLVPLPWH